MLDKTITTSEAGRAVAANALENRRRIAREAAEKRADVTTPLDQTLGRAALATIPEPAGLFDERPAKAARKFSISTEIAYRGRVLTVSAEGMDIDQFCDLMEDRGYKAPAPMLLSAPLATPDDLPDGYKLCRKHGAPMKPRSKQGDVWNSHNVGTAEKPLWCKGYAGPDSPGYEVG